MKQKACFLLLLLFTLCSKYSSAQQAAFTDNEIAVIAAQRGIQPVDLPGFIAHYRKLNSPQQRTAMPTPAVAAPVSIFNFGFENGDFSGWTGYIGDNDIMSDSIWSNVQNGFFSDTNNALVINCNARHTIFDTSSTDPCGNFQILHPAMGNNVVRLNNSCASYMGAGLKKSWTVAANSSTLYMSYALLLNDGGHATSEAPYFLYEITDTLTDSILLRRLVMADINTTLPFTMCPSDPFTSRLPWHTDTLDLSAYINQTVEIRMEVAGCIYGGHFGYAYVNVDLPNLIGTEEIAQPNIVLFPNPANEIVQLNYSAPVDNNSFVMITDLAGRRMAADLTQTASGWTINVSELDAGMYLVSVITHDQQVFTKQLFVQRD